MPEYQSLSTQELLDLERQLQKEYAAWQAKGLQLDMSRGKPSTEQLDLSMGMMDIFSSQHPMKTDSGVDIRNYGQLEGIWEARELFSKVIGVAPEEMIVCGNSSLIVMYDTVARAMLHGVPGGRKPWGRYEKIKFLCPVPGYDRHFSICEYFDIDMIPIPMKSDGPDMDLIEALVSKDETIKGIWCVPKYSNPQGITYSDAVVRRFANLKPAAPDFRIFWDNAYVIHHLYDDQQDHLLDLFTELKKNGKESMLYMFASTSKISFAGAGVSFLASSLENMVAITKQLSVQTIGPDKINQLRHVLYFQNVENIYEHMRKHAAILRPKFQVVQETLERELGDAGIGRWNNPRGGYFICFEALEGCAKRIVSLCKEAGVVMTSAGATHPYGRDPQDSVIRIAPSFPPVEELRQAAELFSLCVKLASVEKLLAQRAAEEKTPA